MVKNLFTAGSRNLKTRTGGVGQGRL